MYYNAFLFPIQLVHLNLAIELAKKGFAVDNYSYLHGCAPTDATPQSVSKVKDILWKYPTKLQQRTMQKLGMNRALI